MTSCSTQLKISGIPTLAVIQNQRINSTTGYHCASFVPNYLAIRRIYWRLLAHWYWTNTASAGNEGCAVLPQAKKRCLNAVARD